MTVTPTATGRFPESRWTGPAARPSVTFRTRPRQSVGANLSGGTMNRSVFNRRGALRATALGAAVLGAAAAGTSSAAAQTETAGSGSLRVRLRLKLVDRLKRQRFLLQSTKPPIILNGVTYPAEQRSGPPDGSYFLFNDENENERGGITVSPDSAQLSLDWPNVDAMHLGANTFPNAIGAASLSMRQMPDPTIPPDEVGQGDAPQRVLLGTSNAGDGAVLALYDSQGRPRILLQVDGQDVPRIQILDAAGAVVSQLPPEDAEPEGQGTGSAGGLSAYLQPPAPGL